MKPEIKPDAFILFGGFTSGKYPEFVRYLHERNMAILVLDEKNDRTDAQLRILQKSSDHPLKHITEFAFISNHDVTSALRHSLRWSQNYTIRGAYTIRESFVSILGVVADYFGLPNPGLRSTRVCRDKFLQRVYLSEWSPRYQVFRKGEAISPFTEFPAVLKPTGRQASSGVVLVRDHNQLIGELQHYTEEEILLLEQYVQGEEVSVESLIQKETIIFNSITAKRTNHLTSHYFVEMGHTIPAGHFSREITQRILSVNRNVLERLQFADGIAHAEYKITADGTVSIMEIAARNPGDGILPLYFLATGKPIEREIIKIALGETAEYPEPNRAARQVYIDHSCGTLKDVQFNSDSLQPVFYREQGVRPLLVTPKANDRPTLREILIDKPRGQTLGPIRESKDRCGSFLIDAHTHTELDQLENEVFSCIKVVTE